MPQRRRQPQSLIERGIGCVHTLENLIDLAQFPLRDAAFRTRCKQSLDDAGALVVPRFLRAQAVASSMGCITTDQIPDASALHTRYQAPNFRVFLCSVPGEAELHAYADPLSSVNLQGGWCLVRSVVDDQGGLCAGAQLEDLVDLATAVATHDFETFALQGTYSPISPAPMRKPRRSPGTRTPCRRWSPSESESCACQLGAGGQDYAGPARGGATVRISYRHETVNAPVTVIPPLRRFA